MEDVKHPLSAQLETKEVTIMGLPYVIAAVALDGSLILEPKELYGTAESIVTGA